MDALPKPERHPELPESTGEPFESAKAKPEPGETQSDLAMRMLYEEQVRLRGELAALKEKGGKDEEKKDGKGNDEDEERKPPLKQRARQWVKQHPLATILIAISFLVLVFGLILLIHYLKS
jgi:hypothetical protein